jgi:DNA modification methylase
MAKAAEIKPDRRNYRVHDQRNQQLIAKSLKKFGPGRSIVSDAEGNTIAGNGVLKQAKKLKIPLRVIETTGKELVVVKRTDLKPDDPRRAELAVMDNSTSDSSKFDLGLLTEDFGFSELQVLGVDMNYDEKTAEQLQEDEPPALQKKAVCKTGEVWLLGKHRVMCGDCVKLDDVAKLMDGQKAGMVFTDPPYGMFLNTDFSGWSGGNCIGRKHNVSGKKYEKVIGDNGDFKPELITGIFDNFGYCKEIFLFGADYYAEIIPNKNNGSWLVWDKRKETQSEAIGSEFELIWSKQKHKRRMLRHDWFGFLSSKNAKDARNRQHPTQKPISLIVDIFSQWAKAKDLIIVIDVFLGSGSTLIACEQTGRICYGMEISPNYCDVIIKRWQNFTGQRAKRESDGAEYPTEPEARNG